MSLDLTPWMAQGECTKLDSADADRLFFPTRGENTRDAKEICRGCAVREECLEYALAHHEKRGGRSERERRRLARARRLAS